MTDATFTPVSGGGEDAPSEEAGLPFAVHLGTDSEAAAVTLACPSAAVRDLVLAAWARAEAQQGGEAPTPLLSGSGQFGTLAALLRLLVPCGDALGDMVQRQAAEACFMAVQEAAADAYGCVHAACQAQSRPEAFTALFVDVASALGQVLTDRQLPPAAVARLLLARAGAAVATPGLFAVFAGQHVDYLEDLRHAHRMYPTVVGPLMAAVASALAQQVVGETLQQLGFHELGLDVMAWVTDGAPVWNRATPCPSPTMPFPRATALFFPYSLHIFCPAPILVIFGLAPMVSPAPAAKLVAPHHLAARRAATCHSLPCCDVLPLIINHFKPPCR